MMRLPALAVFVLCLAGCFVFDNPYDTTPTATFQIVVNSTFYGGTYVWSSQVNAYKTMRGSTPFYVYMDSTGHWCLAYLLNQDYGSANCSTISLLFGGLPTINGSSWSPGGEISSVDDSLGGLCRTQVAPDSPVIVGNTLQVTFKPSNPGNSATYQWVSSAAQNGPAQNFLGTDSTYTIQSADYHRWIRVIIRPTDSTGTIQGTAVVSQPVYVP